MQVVCYNVNKAIDVKAKLDVNYDFVACSFEKTNALLLPTFTN